MRSLEETGGKHPFVTGFIAGLFAPAAYFFVAEVWLGGPTGTLQVGAGLMLLVGVLLVFPDRSWLRGVGFLVGATIFLAAWVVIGVISLAQHTV